MKSNIAIVIPTYNAKNTIVLLITKILKEVRSARVIVVDDNSPDKTALLVRSAFKTNKSVSLIVRKRKAGRGSAVIKGFQEGLKDKTIKFFVEMDADLCHDPRYIPKLVEKAKRYDVVIASKYHKGSSVVGLPIQRALFSKLVNAYLRVLLGVPVTDYTNGFRCYKRKVIEQINPNELRAKGFIVLAEIAYYLYKKGFLFSEIPFKFRFNNLNSSNFNLSEIKEAFLTTLKLKLHS